MKDIAGMLRTGGFCFINHFEYKVSGRTLDEVDGFLNNLFENYQNRWQNLHPIEKAVSLHNEIIALQSFHDGNKRIARLVLNSILLEQGYPTIQLRQGQNALYVQAVKEGVHFKTLLFLYFFFWFNRFFFVLFFATLHRTLRVLII